MRPLERIAQPRHLRRHHGLHREGGVPQRAGVVAVHLDPVVAVPQVALERLEAAPTGGSFGLVEQVDEGVKHGVHRADTDEARGAVLVVDVVQQPRERRLPQPAWVHALEQPGRSIRQSHGPAVRHHRVPRIHRVAVLGEADLLVRGGVDLLAQLPHQLVLGDRRATAVEPGHGQVDLPAVAPHARRVRGERRRQQPQLGGHRVQPLVGVQVEQGQRELAPGGGPQRTPLGADPAPHARHGLLVRSAPQKPQRHVAQHGGEHAALDSLGVQSDAAVRVLHAADVVDHPLALPLRHGMSAGVGRGDVHRQQKHRPAVVTAPRAVQVLPRGEVLQGALDRRARVELWARPGAHPRVCSASRFRLPPPLRARFRPAGAWSRCASLECRAHQPTSRRATCPRVLRYGSQNEPPSISCSRSSKISVIRPR